MLNPGEMLTNIFAVVVIKWAPSIISVSLHQVHYTSRRLNSGVWHPKARATPSILMMG